MSRINDLINSLCPKGIKFKPLKELCLVLKKGTLKTTDLLEEGFPVINAGRNLYGYYNKYNNEGRAFTLSARGEYAGYINYFHDNFWAGGLCYPYRSYDESIIKTKFIYYYLKNIEKMIRERIVSDGGIPALNKSDLEKIMIPVPPIEVQEEIVKILDKFGELEAELETELEARKSQYEFLRGKLLFNPTYPIFKMKDICVINQGLQIPISQRKKEPGDNRYFYITVQFLKNEGDNFYIENPSENVVCKRDDILVTRTGSTGKIVYGVEGCFHNNFFKVTPIIDLNKKYLYHVLNSTQMFNEMLRVASGGTVPDLPHKKFYEIEIGLPSIEEQNRIVNILDKFDTLVNDISEGLPAEIELRRKQYVYYRNKLLSFEEVSCE